MDTLVMGGTRFNGLHLVQELVRYGHNVTILNRGITEAPVPREVRRLYADRKDRQQLKEVLGPEEFDVVFDISAYVLEDVQSMVDIFEGRAGHYVFASSTVVYAASNILPINEDFPVDSTQRQSDYGRNKLICEDYLVKVYRQRHFPITSARFSMVFGPDNGIIDREQRMFMRLLRGRKILVPGRGTTLSQIGHVDDEARALRMMALNPRTYGEIYNVTGKDYFSDEGYVDTCARAVGVEPQKVFVPAGVMDEASADVRRPLIQRLAPYIHRWDESTVFGIGKLGDHLDYEPFYTFETATQQTYEWFITQGLDKQREYDFSAEDELISRIG
ncbi:MAG: NAD-dependent epimerase/dehydratase family protein [Dehalococcoidia bacterium]|jgi:nucleoside-diphosphate-sugar epimerase|nr:NAD-dependent epimerase/dehydratase family protein [Dehalococcoidia bacterium]